MKENFFSVIIAIIILTVQFLYSSNTLLKLKEYCNVRNKNFNRYKIIYFLIMFTPTALLLFYKVYILSILIYIINFFLINKVVKIFSSYNNELTIEISEYTTLLIRELSINNDLSYIVDEVNRSFNGTIIKDTFTELHEKISRYGEIKALEQALNKTDNVWINAILNSLKSYKLDGNKSNILDGLDEIVEILDVQIDSIQKAKVDNNPVVLSNYIITIIALIGFILNLILNPNAYEYFFCGIKGQAMIIIADILLCLIITINTKMSKGDNA